MGYNYVDRWGIRRETYFEEDRHLYPQRKMVGSESSGLKSVRGSYPFTTTGQDGPSRADYATGMIRFEQLWKFVATRDYVIGDFTWTGIDYLGESSWPNKSNSSGALDTCGFPKDSFYLYQSQWTSQPMIHLLPHWNWPGREGQIIPVIAYTNCEVVELFLNVKSLGAKAVEFPRPGAKGGWNSYEKPPVNPSTADLHCSWDVPYTAGVLRAVGYKAGQVVCEEEMHTASAPAAIVLTTDRETLQADARDVAHLTLKIVDAAGVTVPGADNLITLDVQGAGTLIGMDNGNPASHEDYKANRRKAFEALCLGIVQSGLKPGEIRIKATADGFPQTSVVLHVVAAPVARPPIVTVLQP